MQRSGVRERGRTGQKAEQSSILVDIPFRDPGVHAFQHRIVGGGAEEGVGGEQCTGAYTTDNIKLWPPSALAPANEHAGTEGAVLAAAGEGKKVQRMSALTLQVTYKIVARNGRYCGIDGRKLGRIQRLVPIRERGVRRGHCREHPRRRRGTARQQQQSQQTLKHHEGRVAHASSASARKEKTSISISPQRVVRNDASCVA